MKTVIVITFIFCFGFPWATPHEAARVPAPTPAPVETFSAMGNCLTLPCAKGFFSRDQALPIETPFKLPAPIPIWPPGDGFGSGIINLGGLQVAQVSTFNKVWAANEGGPDNLGATVFEPTGIPEGFSILGFYSQPNNKPLYGWVLVAKDDGCNSSNPALKEPLDYTLVWSTNSLQISQTAPAYFWLPTPPDGYKTVGHLVTTSPEKPTSNSSYGIKCVRSDLTDDLQTDSWVWGAGKFNEFNLYTTRPINRGISAPGLLVGTILAWHGSTSNVSCLKNTNLNLTLTNSMPNLQQIQAIVQAYSPIMYLHPDEEYLPSSVNWFFSNGGLLYKKGVAEPIEIQPNGTNLPQDPNTDGSYWLDLPANESDKERVKAGDLQSAQAYLHVKPMFGGTHTDIAMWVYYPFNGAARAKVGPINIKLGKIGEHVGDWEHVTMRVSNFNGELRSAYFSEHSGGSWIDSSALKFKNGNKFVAYSSLHGHAMYAKPGLVLQGPDGFVGIRNDTAESDKVMDLGLGFEVVSADYLGVAEPAWVNYYRDWGPKIDYDVWEEVRKLEKFLPGKLKDLLEKALRSLPSEVLGEEGPTGPKVKNSWNGDEEVKK